MKRRRSDARFACLGFGLNLSAGEVEELARRLGSVDLTEREAACELAEKGSAAPPAA